MTPSQILDSIRNQVYEQSPNFWNDAEIYAYMWQAECEVAGIIECTESTDDSTTTVVDTAAYSIPSDCLQIKRLTWDNVQLKSIDYRTRDSMDFNSYGASGSTGNPTHYVLFGQEVTLYPIPSSAETLKFWYVAQPSQITASTTTFTIPQMFHHYIIDYCLYRMYAKDQDEIRSNFHKMAWEEEMAKAAMKWNKYRYGDRFPVVKDTDNFPTTEVGIV